VGVTERRERERGQLRSQIIDAARDLLLERGLDGLSMRSIAERIEYSPATIYLYFQDKEALIAEVVRAGFERLQAVTGAELSRLGKDASPALQFGAMGRAYARFAVEHPAFFRVMFELPSTPEVACAEPGQGAEAGTRGLEAAVALVERAVAAGEFADIDARRAATLGWAMVHGLTTLYLSGHLRDQAPSQERFEELVEMSIGSLHEGWKPGASGEEAA
jgi:AcrR family transcriptional regulator